MRPLVSVIMPTYNRRAFLERSIGSVIAQTYLHWELIIIDDGSTDGSRELIERFTAADKRIICHFQSNRGQGVARNRGIKEAKGEFICFIDSDDEYLPGKLERQVAKADEAGALPFSVCGGKWVYENAEPKIKVPQLVSDLRKSLLFRERNGAVHTMAYFYNRDFMLQQSLYFDESLATYDDWELIFRTSAITNYDIVPEPGFVYYIHTAGIHNAHNRVKAITALARKYPDEFIHNPKGRSKWIVPALRLVYYHRFEHHLSSLLDMYSTSNSRKAILMGLFRLNRFVPFLHKVINKIL